MKMNIPREKWPKGNVQKKKQKYAINILKYSASLVVKEMPIKPPMRFPLSDYQSWVELNGTFSPVRV